MNATQTLYNRDDSPAATKPGANGTASDGDVGAADPGSELAPTRESGATATPVPLSLDVVFELLKNERRRRVFRYLTEEDERTTLSDLAEHLAAIENDKPPAAITSSERKRAYVSLYQCHLPKLDEAGVIEFDANRGTVELADHVPQLSRYLDDGASARGEDRWSRYYLALSAAGSTLFGLVTLGGASLGWLGNVLTGAVLLAVGAVALVHRHLERDALVPA